MSTLNQSKLEMELSKQLSTIKKYIFNFATEQQSEQHNKLMEKQCNLIERHLMSFLTLSLEIESAI